MTYNIIVTEIITLGLPEWLFLSIWILNLLFVLSMVFIEKQNPDKVLKWGAVLLLLPIIGFVFYIFFGRGPIFGRRKKIMEKLDKDEEYAKLLDYQKSFIDEVLDWDEPTETFIKYNITANKAFCFSGNDIEIYTDMTKHYEDLFREISKAKDYVNICYFIWRPDESGILLRDTLADLAKKGVKVRVLYDDIGSLTTKKSFFTPLKKAGAEVFAFTPSVFRFLTRNINYRNHRKIVVVDGKVGYIGGSNIGNEYLGMRKRNSPWRDTHLKLTGGIINSLNLRFWQDYSFSTGKEIEFAETEVKSVGKYTAQIISSGPDSTSPTIENTYIKAIYSAKKRIFIQTPYLILDEAFKLALISAVKSGVHVSIMIPGKPDKKTVYYSTIAYALELQKQGIEILIYDGFLHSKTMLVDDNISSVGTFNLDIRSFKLHYEATCLVYGKDFAEKMSEIYLEDASHSKIIDKKYIEDRGIIERILERIFILFSPLL